MKSEQPDRPKCNSESQMPKRQRRNGQHQHQAVGHEFFGLRQAQSEENEQHGQNEVRGARWGNDADGAENQRRRKGDRRDERRFAASLEEADQAAGHQQHDVNPEDSCWFHSFCYSSPGLSHKETQTAQMKSQHFGVVYCSRRSMAGHLEAQNFAWLTFSDHFKRATANFAISGETLRREAGVDDQFKTLAAKRTLDGPGKIHQKNTLAEISAKANLFSDYWGRWARLRPVGDLHRSAKKRVRTDTKRLLSGVARIFIIVARVYAVSAKRDGGCALAGMRLERSNWLESRNQNGMLHAHCRMKSILQTLLGLTLVGIPTSLPAQIVAKPPLPSAESVLRRVVENYEKENDNDRLFGQRYSYTRTKVTEYRNSKGELKKRELKKSANNPAVVSVANRAQPVMSKQESSKDATRNDAVTDTHSNVRGKAFEKRDFTLNDDLLGRFQFTLAGREMVNGRPILILDFRL